MRLKNSVNFDAGVEYIAMAKGFEDRDAFLEIENLSKGVYYILVDLDLNETNDMPICVTNYGYGATHFYDDESG